MNTKIFEPNDVNLGFCAELLKKGEIVAVPTETVYGLAANAFDDEAVLKIFKAKGRPQNNPIICHVNGFEMFKSLTDDCSKKLYDLLEAFWPGPLTVVVKKKANLSPFVVAGLETVGLRFSASWVLNKLIDLCGFPIAAPSANLSKKPSSTNASHVFFDFNGKIPAILDGGQCEIGVESTVVKFNKKGECVLLRPGFITLEMLKSVVKNVEIGSGVLNMIENSDVVESPGILHKHYCPKAEVVVVKGSLKSFVDYVSKKLNEKTWCVVFDGEEVNFEQFVLTYGKTAKQQAKKLFFILRKIDDLKIEKVFFRCSSNINYGLNFAIYNRLIRAANFNIINL